MVYFFNDRKVYTIIGIDPSVNKEVNVIQKGLQHRPFNATSEKHQLFVKSLEEKIAYLQKEYSFMKFNK